MAGSGASAKAAAPRRARRAWLGRGGQVLRGHWLVTVLLGVGLILRVLAQIAYHPALIYVDSLKFLYGEYPGSEPLGYTVLLRLVLLAGGLGLVTALQHLLAMAMAVALYAVLLRQDLPRWLAALAVAPVLLDAYQLQMEQMIMADTLFEALVVAGLAILLGWQTRRRPPGIGLAIAAGAGFVLGVATDVKQAGLVLVAPAVLYCLACGGGTKRALKSSAALAVAFAVPILAYCAYSDATTGHFRLANRQPLAGRLVAAADCATLKLPAAVRPLCPTPAEQAHGPDWLEHSGQSPLYRTPVAPGTRGQLIAELNSAIEQQQPLRVGAAIARDWLRLFALTRQPVEAVTPLSRWQFQVTYPTYPPWIELGAGHQIIVGIQGVGFGPFRHSVLKPSYGGPAQVDRPVARFLRSYQLDGGYTPGPLFALFALAGVAASVLLLRSRSSSQALPYARASLLFTAAAAVLLLLPDVYEFSWRYQLPALVTLPPAGVLGLAALLANRRQARAQRAGQPDQEDRPDQAEPPDRQPEPEQEGEPSQPSQSAEAHSVP
jgi:hypothetical protein